MSAFKPAETIDLARKMLNYANSISISPDGCLPACCPQCGHPDMHVIWVAFTPQKAGLWVWCSHCKASEHASSKPPEWWENMVNPDITATLLDENFENFKLEIDQHVRAFVAIIGG